MTGKKADLHLHTTYSDGFFSPQDVIGKAKSKNISIISITDHDSVSSFEEASVFAENEGILLISGTELSTYIDGREIHILGYFLDTQNDELKKILKFFCDERTHRAERILWKLKNQGITIGIEEVLESAKNSPITRPHIASLLVDKGFVKTYYEAFNLYLGNNAPCYERKIHIDPGTVFEVVTAADGLSFIAHPANTPEDIIRKLIDAGVDGIEVVHPSHSPSQEKSFRELANAYFLLQSGGSDFHGGKKNDEDNFGNFCIPESYVNNMKKRLVKAKPA